MSAPAHATTTAAPATAAPAAGNASGPVDNRDVQHWQNKFNAVLAQPSEHINSKSPATAQTWTSQFFGCFDPIDLCLITCCVPCVTFGKTHHRMHKHANMEGYEPVNTSCLLLLAASCVGCPCIPVAMQRADVRERYNLQGDCITDLLMSWCCGCCSLIQAEKESAHREPLLAQQGNKEQYQAQPAMEFPPKN